MTPGGMLSASMSCFFVGEAFSLDRRGWKAAPTGDKPTDLERRSNVNPGQRVQMWERRPASIVIAARFRSHREITVAIGTLFWQLPSAGHAGPVHDDAFGRRLMFS
jgi:hypothetical protein